MEVLDSPLTYEELLPRVTKGAEWFDHVHPGWERSIDLTKLDLQHPCRCILGQVIEKTTCLVDYKAHEIYPHIGEPLDGFMSTFVIVNDSQWLTDRGFNLEAQELCATNWITLNQVWHDLLKERFNSGNLSDSETW